MQHRKASATFLDFIEPVFLTPSGPPTSMYGQILEIAVLVWNAAHFDDQQSTDFLSNLRNRLRLLDGPNGRRLMFALVEDLIVRKRTEFADERWIIGTWELIPHPEGSLRVHVEARELLSRT